MMMKIEFTCIAYVVQSSAVLRKFYDLDGRIVTNLWCIVRRQWDLRKTECTVVLLIGRTGDLEDADHAVGVVEWLGFVTHVDKELCVCVAGKPAWLN